MKTVVDYNKLIQRPDITFHHIITFMINACKSNTVINYG